MSAEGPAQAPRGIALWWQAARPRTLPLAVAPVAVGTALAYAQDALAPGPALAATLGALLLQIGANFANDVFDAASGADTEERIGPPRAVALGWVSPGRMQVATATSFGLALPLGLYLMHVAGWPIFALGLLSILAAYAYTGGPWPLGYHGLGELTVFLFFGLVAVGGSYYVQARALSSEVLLAAVPVGALAAAVLVVNNLRDVSGDARAGKRTLAVRLGRQGARTEYALLLAVSYLVPAILVMAGWHLLVALPILTLPRALLLLQTIRTREDGSSLNEALAGTAALALRFSVLLAAGIALSH